ncbi:MAG: hypothetical protein H6624_08275 [Bdellovibrionaceae bacterium]|nr:hypothetical protein [Bdellovibrionales bacterium]MCB9084328.1 hypothetical protein [Pseudobdellovibrionaceae bacterium]
MVRYRTMDYKRLVSQLENKNRQGKGLEVRRSLKKLSLKSIPHEHRLPLANLARRNNLPDLTVRILKPLVRPAAGLKSSANPNELAEYAVGLSYLGVTKEAENILSTIRPEDVPQVLLFQSFMHFSRWEYAQAAPLLRTYCQFPKLEDYQRLVGRVNLAAALINSSATGEAESLLADLLRETEERKLSLLHGNCLELNAQLMLEQKKFAEALNLLKRSESNLSQGGNLSQFYVFKLQMLLPVLQGDSSAPALRNLRRLREEALRVHHWETLRECDLHEAGITQDSDLAAHLYFGTPYRSYRERILSATEGFFVPPHDYVFTRDQGADPLIVFDLMGAQIEGKKAQLPKGKNLHRGIYFLSRDQYRPIRLGGLFSSLFPQDYFDPVTSPDRIYQLIKRLRAWLKKAHLDLTIEETDGAYSLVIGEGLGLRIGEELSSEYNKELMQLMHVREQLGKSDFTAKQACKALGFSRTSFNAFINSCMDQNLVLRAGSGRNTSYKIVEPHAQAG